MTNTRQDTAQTLGQKTKRPIVKLTPSPSPTPIPTTAPTPTAIPTPTPIPPTVTIQPISTQPTTKQMLVTMYGWNDNDPPGTAIAYPASSLYLTRHNAAGGTGTYNDPISLASDPKEWSVGSIFYVPFLQKYFIMEDWCQQCVQDWSIGKYHIDLWVNSDGTNQDKLLECEYSLTRANTDIEINPPPNRSVSLTPLFDPATGACYSP